MTDQPPPSPRRKSETRQRTRQVKTRLTAAEYADFLSRADKAGLSAAAFLRTAALGTAGPRAQRRTPMDAALMREVLGHLGRVGNNLNQIARHLNTGRPGDQGEALIEALGDFARIRDLLYVALGKEPDHTPPAIPAPDPVLPASGLPPVAAAFAAAADPGGRKIALPAASTPPEASEASPAAPEASPAKDGSRFIRPRQPGPGKGP